MAIGRASKRTDQTVDVDTLSLIEKFIERNPPPGRGHTSVFSGDGVPQDRQQVLAQRKSGGEKSFAKSFPVVQSPLSKGQDGGRYNPFGTMYDAFGLESPVRGGLDQPAQGSSNNLPDRLYGTEGLHDRLESTLEDLRKARDEQVRKNGSSAAAPYNTAIAQIQTELDKTAQQRIDSGEIFDKHRQSTQQAFDRQSAATQAIAEGAESAQIAAGNAVIEQAAKNFDAHERTMMAAMKSLGASDEMALKVAQSTGEIEARVMNLLEVTRDSMAEVHAAGKVVAEQAAKSAASVTEYESKVQEQMLDLQLQDRINKMLDEKKKLEAQRSAAASRARQMTREQLPDQTPFGEDLYAQAHMQVYFRDIVDVEGFNVGFLGTLATLASAALSEGAFDANVLKGLFYDDLGDNSGSAFSGFLKGFTTSEIDSLFKWTHASLQVYQEAADNYNQLRGQDYTTYAPWSLDRMNILFEEKFSTGLVSWEQAVEWATDPGNHEEYNEGSTHLKPKWFEEEEEEKDRPFRPGRQQPQAPRRLGLYG